MLVPALVRRGSDIGRPAEAGARSQLLHWFSKSREEAGDRHACFLPPLLARPAALVCRGGRAAGYSTYTLDGS